MGTGYLKGCLFGVPGCLPPSPFPTPNLIADKIHHPSLLCPNVALRFFPTWLPYDPAIPLLGIHQDKTLIQKDTCTPVFIAALFTITKTWKQPRYPSIDEWIKKMWYLYTTEYYSAIKKNEFLIHTTTWINFRKLH